MQEPRAEADRGPVHEDKGTRRSDAAQFADLAMHAVDEPDAIGRSGSSLLDRPRPVVEQWAVYEARPAVQHRDHLARQIAEAPAAVGIDRQRLVVAFERVIEI